MKTNLQSLFVVLLVGFGLSLSAQIEGAKKYVLFEHFTNTSCGPCATQNPVFKAFYDEHSTSARHLSMHTSWPGSGDPMYVPVKNESAAFVSYYGVTGVPDMFANGRGIGGPTNASTDMLDTEISPIRIKVSQTGSGFSKELKVVVETLGDLDPGANYVIKVAAIEGSIKYNNPPGNNGERSFENVFRKWIVDAETFTPAAKGASVEFDYSYKLIDTWQSAEMYVLAYIVNTDTKEVVNTGSLNDSNIELVTKDHKIQKSVTSGNHISVSAINTGDTDQSLTVELLSSHPSDWNSTFGINGNDFTDKTTFDVAPGEQVINIDVNPGSSSAVGRYELKLTYGNNSQSQFFTILNNITDLVTTVKSNAVDLEGSLDSGLKNANNTTTGILSIGEFSKAYEAGTLSDINNVYLNIGWTFPAFSDDLIKQLTALLVDGKNLFISGQDVGWDVLSGHMSANGTVLQKQFFEKFLHVGFEDDGSGSTKEFTILADDDIFGRVEGTSEILAPYGGDRLFPDHMTAYDEYAKVFAQYPDGGGMGVRAKKDDYKIVYLGIGLEQVGDTDIADKIVSVSHDWFYGLISGVEFDQALSGLLGQNKPNPADGFTVISIDDNQKKDLEIVIFDMNGKKILSQEVLGNSVNINTSKFDNGFYFYNVNSSNGKSVAKKMVIMH